MALTMVGIAVLSMLISVAPTFATRSVWSCTDDSNVKAVPLPVPINTPGGRSATAIYLDDRPVGGLGPVPPGIGGVFIPGMGLLGQNGEGTRIYFETDGFSMLQRGGWSDLLPYAPLWPGLGDVEPCDWGCDEFGGVDPDLGTGCVIHDELLR